MPGLSVRRSLPVFDDDAFSWAAWWASLVSATVEQAAPTHVVMTFPTAQPSLGASDFTIAGFTIISASWSGAVLTLVLAETVALGDILVVTFVTTGGTVAVTNNVTHPLIIEDGNTVAWFDHDYIPSITMDAALRVSQWNDRLGSGHDLLQANGADQPLWSFANGVLFDGVSEYMKCVGFPFVQPEFIYFVGRQVTWTFTDRIFDGNIDSGGASIQSAITPEINLYAGNVASINNNFILNIFAILRCLFNGVNSSLQVNQTAPTLGNCGVANMNGFTLGSRGSTLSFYSNVQVKEIILRNVADGVGVQAQIYNYLQTANGL